MTLSKKKRVVLLALCCLPIFYLGLGELGGRWLDVLAGPNVVFVVPADYRGPLVVVEDGSADQDLAGHKVIFSSDGVARVKSLEILRDGYRRQGLYVDGRAIPDSDFDPDVVSLRSGIFRSRTGCSDDYVLLLGNEKEERRFFNDVDNRRFDDLSRRRWSEI